MITESETFNNDKTFKFELQPLLQNNEELKKEIDDIGSMSVFKSTKEEFEESMHQFLGIVDTN